MPRLLELFSGTGSVGRAFQRAGWEVVSVDVCPTFQPTHCVNILDWECPYAPGHFNMVWASVPCEQYSIARTTARKPRDFETADACAERALEIIAELQPEFFAIENPSTSLLRTRPFMQGIPYVECSYCAYGRPFRKNTKLFTNLPIQPKVCPGPKKCPQMEGRRHLKTAQRGPSGGRKDDRFCREDLFRIPDELCDEIAAACA
jgi:hypothetical protein